MGFVLWDWLGFRECEAGCFLRCEWYGLFFRLFSCFCCPSFLRGTFGIFCFFVFVLSFFFFFVVVVFVFFFFFFFFFFYESCVWGGVFCFFFFNVTFRDEDV